MSTNISTRLVVDHLRRIGILSTDAGTPLSLGIPGVALGADGELAIDGKRCIPQRRTVSDLLGIGHGQGAYFANRAEVVAAHRAGYDPVLYDAFRDFLPPRDKGSCRFAPAGPSEGQLSGRTHIFADLIVYRPGILPGGELFRSTGHWNLPGQLEIFHILSGRVLMLVGGHTRDGRRFLYQQVCEPGEMVVVPFGVWHVSYVLDGPAAVFNVTTDADTASGVADRVAGKYERAAPVAITACRHGESYTFTGTRDALRAWGEPTAAPTCDWLRMDISVADLHLYASPKRLAEIQDAALAAYHACWPIAR